MNIEFENVSKKFGKEEVLKNFNYSFEDGKTSFLMGPSGIGKSTIIRIILGLEKDYSGQVKGLEKRKISAVFQDDSLCKNLSVFLNIKIVSDNISQKEIVKNISEMGLEDLANKRVRELSGGQKRRVAILRALSVDFDTLVMDEPFKGLDSENKKKVMDIVIEASKGKSLIIVSHDIGEYRYFKRAREINLLDMKEYKNINI